MKYYKLMQNSPKQEALLRFLKETQDGKFTEVKKEILNPNCARITVLRQTQTGRPHYFSIG
jgi:hypothetical protein